ncbi:MAG: InlB B-repeat-containing protein, partial [Alphaproteobacteria bacterium]|nr:InlB B-repeat-containing protein [Alphaproteobacteria bacterium]
LLKAFLSTIFIVSGAFAESDIASTASSADCKYTPLETYSGTSNLTANWEANAIDLHWYNNNTLMENVADESSDCTYGGTLTPPSTIPTRTGYTFKGWKVRPTYNFATLSTTSNGTERWAIGLSGSSDYCWHASGTASATQVSCTAYPEYYKEIQRYEWKVTFSWGDVYGSSYCSGKSGNHNNYTWNNDSSNWKASYSELESASGTKQYCWCQATGYKPSGESTLYGPESVSAGSAWVFSNDYGSAANCARNCATGCASYVLRYSGFRRAVFGVSQ